MRSICLCCGENGVSEYINFGNQPPSNRFPLTIDEIVLDHSLRLGCCDNCGHTQLIDPMPPDKVRPIYNWLAYNEPEGHLDNLVDALSSKIVNKHKFSILGITYKDDSTLDRLKKRGAKTSYRLDEKEDLKIHQPCSGLESIQSSLDVSRAADIVSKHGLSDIVLARHVLEHSHKPMSFLDAVLALCKPNGVVVFEVPDCSQVFKGADHCFIWEEHISYFSKESLKNFLLLAGLTEVEILSYPYAMENSLVAIIRNRRSRSTYLAPTQHQDRLMIESFANSFKYKKYCVNKFFCEMYKEGKIIVLFGAGHLSIKYINFYELSSSLMGVIDDNPNKCQRFLPGSGVPIIPSSVLLNERVDFCLLTLNPESDYRVRNQNKKYVESGGRFISIFSSNPENLDKEIAYYG
jgi:hypothetical protein